MRIVHAGDELQQRWNEFVGTHGRDGGFLQSWWWGDFQKSLGHKIYRLAGLGSEGELEAVALVIKTELPFEYSYLYVPRGPVVISLKTVAFSAMLKEIEKIGREEKSFLVRIDPAWEIDPTKETHPYAKPLEQLGFRKSEAEVQPKCVFMLKLAPTEAELLASMKAKTRYNINLAARKGVSVRTSSELTDLESFWRLTKETSERDNIKAHTKEHYLKMFETIGPSGVLQLYLAEFEGKVIAANLVSYFGTTVTYLHGASGDAYREAMAPYLLQWEAIKTAKSLGYQQYDFGGVNGHTFHNPKWAGITRFKSGFGQEIPATEYIGSYEQILNPVVFAAYKFIKQIRE